MEKETEIKVGQKWKHRGRNIFGKICHIDDKGNVFITDDPTGKLYMCHSRDFFDEFIQVEGSITRLDFFKKEFKENLIMSLICVPFFLASLALAEYLDFELLIYIVILIVSSAIFALWRTWKL